MKSRRAASRWVGPVAAVLVSVGSLAGSALALDPGRQIVTADEIRRAGITRLGDLPLLAEGWDVVSIDRFERRVSPRGLASFEHATWDLFVDGRRVDLDQLGSRNLNRLPIALEAVASVEFFHSPGFVDGHLAEAGAIHIHTKKPQPGTTLAARGSTGSETGDPGPFFYTSTDARDVERDGYEASGTLAWAGNSVQVRGSVRAAEHVAGDHAILERMRALGDGRPWIYDLLASSAGAAWEGRRSSLDVEAGLSRVDHAWFFRPWGREIPVTADHLEVRARGRRRQGAFALEAGASWFENRIAAREGMDGPDLDWERRTALLDGSATIEGRAGRARFGAELERARLSSGVEGFSIARVRADLSSAGNEGNGPRLGLEVARADGTTGGKLLLRHHWLAGVTSLDATASWSRSLPVEDGRVWLWRERGLDLIENAGLEVEGAGPIGAVRTQSFDFAATQPLGRIAVTVAPMLRLYSGLTVETQSFASGPGATAFASPTGLHPDAEGVVAGVEARVSGSAARVAWRASYRYQSVFDASAPFVVLWAPVPEHRARLTIDVDPAAGLTVRAVARAVGRRLWPEYAGTAEIGPSLVLDLSLRKQLLGDRFGMGLALLNLLDEDRPEHPIGAVSGLRFVAQADVALGADSLRR